MITVKKEKLTRLKDRWNKLLTQNTTMQPYQDWEMVKIIKKYYLPFTLSEKEIPEFFSFIENGKTIAIAPMVKRYGDNQRYANFGKAPTIAVKDFIYPADMTPEKMEECLDALRQKLKSIRFYDVPEYSLLGQVLEKIAQRCKNHIYTMIPFIDGYDSYYQGLSKHMRQNIRTAYNYLMKNNIDYSFEVVSGKNLSKKDEEAILDIYLARRDDHSAKDGTKKPVSPLHKFYLRHLHYYTIAHRKLESSYFGILRINGKIAAFWSGFANPNKDYISCPRFALDNEYVRCSPGIILLCETAKHLEAETGIAKLDLSRGNHDYKMRMGGENYYSHDYILE